MVSPNVAEAMAMFLACDAITLRGSLRVKKASAAKIRPGAPATRKAARQPLSADRVLGTALRIVDKEGLDGLSMRRVAQALGTGAASLYAYFSGKDELLEQLLDRVWGQDAELELRTVDVHIRRLRRALNANGGSDLLRTVRSVGYALDSAES